MGREEKKKQKESLLPAHLGLAAGVMPVVSHPWHLSKVPYDKALPTLTALEFAKKIQTGDIMLTQSKSPLSAFQLAGAAVGGSPYYHAEIFGGKSPAYLKLYPSLAPVDVLAGGKSVEGSLNRYASTRRALAKNLKEQNRAILLRPKKSLTREEFRALNEAINTLAGQPYSDIKPIPLGIRRLLVPGTATLTSPKALKDVKGIRHVCSTGPAACYRQIGKDLKMIAPKGQELAADYLSSPKLKQVAFYGDKPIPSYASRVTLPLRAGLGVGLGFGTHALAKDIRDKDYGALSGMSVGMGAGGAAGALTDLAGYKAETNPKGVLKILQKKLKVPPKHAKRIVDLLQKIQAKFLLTPTVAGLFGGAVLGHHLGKRKD